MVPLLMCYDTHGLAGWHEKQHTGITIGRYTLSHYYYLDRDPWHVVLA